MSAEELVRRKQPFITAYVQRFRETKNILFLLKALILTVRQQRILEVIYGGFCALFHRPSRVCSDDNEAPLISILKEKSVLAHYGTRSRARLIQVYGEAFRVDLLPADFQGARGESIGHDRERLIIGEYGENSRIAYVTSGACVMSDHYRRFPGVRHIHSIEMYGDGGEFLVSTGDTHKFLDLWIARNGEVNFVRRLRKHLAGFTAAVRVNGEYYFGTDFSNRPNFITALGGATYFFPSKAYRLHVTAFYGYFDRYIVSINEEFRIVGGRRTLSVFDAVQKRFIFCDYWPVGRAFPRGAA